MNIKKQIEASVLSATKALYKTDNSLNLPVQKTRKEFEGDFTVVVFPLSKVARKKPEAIGEEIGEWLVQNSNEIESCNTVKGFLNIKLKSSFWTARLKELQKGAALFEKTDSPDRIMVEYSSPNTNKPLHLGHIRNNLLGYSIAEIFKARGHDVIKANLVNDRGIHICKSMLAWQRFGNGETPESSGMKGDHLVGKYYVEFEKAYQKEIADLVEQGIEKEEAKKKANLMYETQEMLRKWEAGDKEVIELWKTMNSWVYSGFEKTYEALGVDFDKFYYESNTYLLGKDLIKEGLDKEVFFKKEDGSVWADLTSDGLDEKLVQRSDGTSVYMTQDIGTAELKYQDYSINRSVYVVGDEQEYHFKVLRLIMQKLGKPYADGIYHLSYGMIDLPTGRMKSREGTVVDADDLIKEMERVAAKQTEELGKTESLSPEKLDELYSILGLGALKYYLLKVDPKKRMTFNPEESIDFQGNTGPFIQYNHTRIASLGRKLGLDLASVDTGSLSEELAEVEREICIQLCSFEEALKDAEENYSPAVLANYCFELAKTFSRFFAELSVVREEDELKRKTRMVLCAQVARALREGMSLLGITLPTRM